MELEGLKEIISSILVTDNNLEEQLESHFNEFKAKDINKYILTLIHLFETSPNLDSRISYIKHLKNHLSSFSNKESEWLNLDGQTQNFVKSSLFDILLKETNDVCKVHLCELIGELAASIKTMSQEEKEQSTEEGREYDLVNQNLWKFLASEDIILIEHGLRILSVLCESCPKEYIVYKEEICNALKETLQNENFIIKVRAIEGLAAFLEYVPLKNYKIFATLIPFVLDIIPAVIDSEESLGKQIITCVENMMKSVPEIFRPNFMQTVNAIKSAVQKPTIVNPQFREEILRLLVLLLEYSPSFAAKQNNVRDIIFDTILSFMITCTGEIDEEWLCPSKISDEGDADVLEESVSNCASLINRAIACLGERSVPSLFQKVKEMVATNDWKAKYSALLGLAQIAEYIVDIEDLEPVVSYVLEFLSDENPKVRYAALHCLGLFGDDKKPNFQLRFNKTVIPAFIELFNEQVPRVLMHSLSALSIFVEGMIKRPIEEWIEKILEPCFPLFELGHHLGVKEGAFTVLSSLALASDEKFIPYWEKTTNKLFAILSSDSEECLPIKGRAMECLGIVCGAVKRDEFKKVLPEAVKVLIHFQNQMENRPDHQRVFLFAAWQRFSKTFEEEFTPYLKENLPSLITLTERIVVEFLQRKFMNSIEDDRESVEDKYGREELSIILKMIQTFLIMSPEAHEPFIEKISKILFAMLGVVKNAELISEVAKIFPLIVNVLKATNKELLEVSNQYARILWKLYQDEEDHQNRFAFLASIKNITKQVITLLQPEQVGEILTNSILALFESNARKQGNNNILHDELEEDELQLFKNQNDKEDELHCALAEVIETVLISATKQHAKILVNFVLKNIPNIGFTGNTNSKLNKYLVTLLNAIFKYLGYKLVPAEMPILISILLKFLQSENIEVRGLASLGVGILAETLGPKFEEIAEECVDTLCRSLLARNAPELREAANRVSREQSVIALGKIIKYQSENIDVRRTQVAWLWNLPIMIFSNEGKEQHEWVMDLILDFDPSIVLGKQGELMTFFVGFFAMLQNERIFVESTTNKGKQILRMLEKDVRLKPLLKAAINRLTPALRKAYDETMDRDMEIEN